jgi:hypothetical protein
LSFIYMTLYSETTNRMDIIEMIDQIKRWRESHAPQQNVSAMARWRVSYKFLSSSHVWFRGQDAASEARHCRNTNVRRNREMYFPPCSVSTDCCTATRGYVFQFSFARVGQWSTSWTLTCDLAPAQRVLSSGLIE